VPAGTPAGFVSSDYSRSSRNVKPGGGEGSVLSRILWRRKFISLWIAKSALLPVDERSTFERNLYKLSQWDTPGGEPLFTFRVDGKNSVDFTKERMNQELPELTDEQKEAFDSIVGETGSEGLQKIEIVSTPDDQDLESESPMLVYKDENGNEIAEEIDIDEWNMTDEEAEDDMKHITEEINQMMKDYAKNKEAHDNGEEVSLPAVEEKDYEPTFESGNDDETYDPYEGYGSYEAYLNAARELFPDMSEEELRSRFPDEAKIHVEEI